MFARAAGLLRITSPLVGPARTPLRFAPRALCSANSFDPVTCSTKNRNKPLKTKQKGINIIHDPLWNKGLAFGMSERDRLNLRGLLPPRVKTLEEQTARFMRNLRAIGDGSEAAIKKNLALQELHNRNETLYHSVLVGHMSEVAPLIYTPTVGHVCQAFGSNYTRARGMYFSREDRGHFSSMVYNWPHDDVHVIVVTDGSRILGLGDLGAHGMGIPIGKLALYVAAGGIAPHRVLPIVVDVGTNNDALLSDHEYIGVRERRLEGKEYFEMLDEFMEAVFDRWPQVVVQFEDFETSKAMPLLAKYRDTHRVFNDDIQGTGCVTLAGLIAAARASGTRLSDQRILCAGAGSAGLGVCLQIVDGMVEEGLSRDEAMSRFVVCTSQGAIGAPDGAYGDPNHMRGLGADRAPWVNPEVSDGMSMAEVVHQWKPSCLLGLAAQPAGLFTEEIVRSMAASHAAPIIMPMSNPTAKAECTPQQAYTWTDGKAVVATGSPFDPVSLPGGRTLIPSQCNNMYVFPGIGLAASVAGVAHVTDAMLYAAAVACVDAMEPAEVADGRTFPVLSRIREVSHAVACAVIEKAFDDGVPTKLKRAEVPTKEALHAFVLRKMYYPAYVPLVDPS